ncbi:MAG: hypothetical protein EBQ96_03740 [Proteobacteria bacterium]|nr:hypothetical protein [Pseudomonadota bacterium]
MTNDDLLRLATANAQKKGRAAPPRVYLAGPEVFLPDAFAIGLAKKRICAEYGLLGIFPFDGDVDLSAFTPHGAGMEISRKNEEIMRGADTIIANATPWHGPSLDVGTAFEIGFMRALGKPLFVYSNVSKLFFERLQGYFNHQIMQDEHGFWRETANKTSLEPFDMHDNLMIDGAAIASGGHIMGQDVADRLRDLDTFRLIVPKVAERFYGQALTPASGDRPRVA